MWQQLDKATNATHNLSILQLLLVTELASQIAMLVLSLLLVSLFYKKRDTFPKTMIVFLACNLTFNVLDNLACNYIFEKKGFRSCLLEKNLNSTQTTRFNNLRVGHKIR